MAPQSIKALLAKEKVINLNVIEIKNKLSEELELCDYKLIYDKLNSLKSEINEIYGCIYTVCKDEDVDTYVNQQAELCKTLETLEFETNRKLHESNERENCKKSIIHSAENNVKLPTLELTIFSGNQHEWLSFRDIFKATIHENPNLSDAMKLQYLKSSLRDGPLQVIQTIPILNSNYELAWSLLEERYSNVREQIFAHLKRFINIPNVQNESSNSILHLIDVSRETVRALSSLDQKVEGFSATMFAYILMQKLDSNSKLWFERQLKKDDVPNLEQLLEFLQNHARTLAASKPSSNSNIRKNYKTSSFVAGVKNKNSRNECSFCLKNCFAIYKCPKFLNSSVRDRIKFAKQKNLCFLCLSVKSKYHNAINCENNKFCCKNHIDKRHHFLLCFGYETKQTQEVEDVIERSESSTPPEICKGNKSCSSLNPSASPFEINSESFVGTARIMNKNKNALLCTVIAYVKDIYGNLMPIRCVLDCGSELCFCTTELIKSLGSSKRKTDVTVSGLSSTSINIKNKAVLTIYNKSGDFSKSLEVLIIKNILSVTPSKHIDVSGIKLPINAKLADPRFNEPGKIDLLIGVDTFWDILKTDRIRIENTNLIMQDTHFGFMLSGAFCDNANEQKSVSCGLITEMDNLNNQMRKFWEIEEVEPQVNNLKSKENEICEDHFQKTHVRKEDGRYIVQMPFKEDPGVLGDSKAIAFKRLDSLWNRLGKDAEYLNLYKSFLNEYEKLGHMSEVTSSDEPKVTYYMPHHGVYRPEKSSTKLRVVFNASAETNRGNSLNSIQLNGGVIQRDLYDHMLNFRRYRYAFTADIQKMYRMIEIDQSQRKLQRILWKENANAPVKLYELNTVTYGTVSAPFLAMRTLRQIADDEGHNFPLAEPVIRQNFYMDDVLAGAETLSEVQELKFQLTCALQSAGMELHKWCSNCPSLLTDDGLMYSFSDTTETKTLGVLWNCHHDKFVFKADPPGDALTKRQVLSTIARIFDPLGLVGPVIAKAKIFMQRLWLLQIDWGDPLPDRESEEWKRFLTSLSTLILVIPRVIFLPKAVCIELHGFADASAKCYGAVVYAKTKNSASETLVRLVSSKSRCAPVKTITIPRLELSAAVLLSKLMKRIQTTLDLHTCNIFLWSDSMIVLSWIAKESSQLKTFVANRVATIQDLTSTQQWRHVPTDQNPADLVSRGLDPDKLSQNSLWFEGPEFLKGDEYPSKLIVPPIQREDYSKELKTCDSKILNCFNVTISSFIDDLLKYCSTYLKLIRVLSFIYRFIQNCRSSQKRSGPLDVEELHRAETFLLNSIQSIDFQKEVKDLKRSGMVSRDSKVKTLHPYLDDNGVLRVGGRLTDSDLSFNAKFPILLPSNHKVTRLIIESYHKRHFHVGPQALLHGIRQKFWPLSGRSLCRKIVHECIVCEKMKPTVTSQLMGNLPRDRVVQNYPFNCVGLDFCGPFKIKYTNHRKGTLHKIFVCIFICFSTKCVHIEIVTDLTAAALIATLKRFFARRGKSAKIYSDNGKNLVGANNEIKKLLKLVSQQEDRISDYLSSEGIAWSFIPPRTPSFGGLWEAAVKSFKYYVKRAVGGSNLTYEEFITVSNQIEAILNSRPLTPLSSDPSDLEALTPGHFLIGRPLNAIPEPDLTYLNDNRLSRWQRTTKIVQNIWKRWSHDYLNNLQQRSKWQFEKNNVKIGSLVVLKEDNLPCCKWLLGRIMEVFPGKDGKIRVVSVKTGSGTFKRGIQKVCVLPIE